MEEKVFFTPGDIVTLKQEINDVPKMIVKSIDKAAYRGGEKSMLFGVTCFWFTSVGEYQENRFNTKDLVHCD
jgi:uncharacterized protein YodC (DUF2158 family)